MSTSLPTSRDSSGLVPSPARRARPPEAPLAILLTAATLGVIRFFAVPQGYVAVVSAFGTYCFTVQPGLRCCLSLWGLYRTPSHYMPTQEQMVGFGEDVLTSNAVRMYLALIVGIRVTDAFKAAFEINDYLLAVENLIRAIVRNECARRNGSQLLGSREEISRAIQNTLMKDSEPWGIQVTRVEIADLHLKMEGETAYGQDARP